MGGVCCRMNTPLDLNSMFTHSALQDMCDGSDAQRKQGTQICKYSLNERHSTLSLCHLFTGFKPSSLRISLDINTHTKTLTH